jgi:hypothetical protein
MKIEPPVVFYPKYWVAEQARMAKVRVEAGT